MPETYRATIKISSQCDCTVIDEITGEDRDSDECFGCHKDNVDLLISEVLEPWMKANNLTESSTVKFSVMNLTWANRSGSGLVEVSDLLKGDYATIMRGDYTVYWTLVGDKLTAVRYSHDEPTGATYNFQPKKIQFYPTEPACPVCHRTTGHDCELGKEY